MRQISAARNRRSGPPHPSTPLGVTRSLTKGHPARGVYPEPLRCAQGRSQAEGRTGGPRSVAAATEGKVFMGCRPGSLPRTRRRSFFIACCVCVAFFIVFVQVASAQSPVRARELGVPFEGTAGRYDAITDVAGVEVGYTTLISGSGKLVVGVGPVRTGVTAILPRGKTFQDPVFAGFFSQNGNGEMTGIHWVKESGLLEGPIMITNTHSVGVVRDAVIAWEMKNGGMHWPWFLTGSLPVVAETYDGYVNDINGFHVKPQNAWQAIETAQSGPLAEGNVGGGTGMACFGFKGGTGTASRVLPAADGGYSVGVLVQCNTGSPYELRIAGVPVGRLIPVKSPWASLYGPNRTDMGSIIIVIATNAPLTATQLNRLCKRATLGLGRVGGTSGDGSGDLFISFSTANPGAEIEPPKHPISPPPIAHIQMLPNWSLDPLFNATIHATEEAIVNAMVAAKTMTGADGHTLTALPHSNLRALMHEKFSPSAW
jgi:D-aminopeptidase